jgi:hypothetical protein
MDIDYFGVGCCGEQGAPENEIKLSFAPLLLSPDFVECQKSYKTHQNASSSFRGRSF